MSDEDEIVFETALDAPPEKVWRALTVPEYLERWLDRPANTEIDRVASDENRSLTYRWREAVPGAAGPEESFVTFELTRQADGGTWFRLTHRSAAAPVAANTNEPGPATLMRAA
ncbi:SRPBCC family protein [Devosia salina]|uniref:SRPBCC domain-containing protein n=1 Tax=Devosia salina TaxID=2860336 RepID=A0ABX8W963_9HYPH|nr:SRPBCC domain-containing protein [Devosia salina]QYO75236.1 SRPBCC domain-containing protein [Devosia salina]